MFFRFHASPLQKNVQRLKKRHKSVLGPRFLQFYPKTIENTTSGMVKYRIFPV